VALSGDSVFGMRQWLLPSAAQGFASRSDAERLRADQGRFIGSGGDLQAGEVAEAIELRAALREREAATLPANLAAWQPR
jgi:hypothetical protein